MPGYYWTHSLYSKKICYLNRKRRGEYGILMTPKEKLAQALFTLNFLDLRLDHTMPVAILHFQNTILRIILLVKWFVDNTPVLWEHAMNNWCKGLRLKTEWGYALVISDDGQHHWIPGSHVKERKEKDVTRHRASQGAASDGENKTDDQ